jgi:ssRNA-specific RNase YbeY (16S rRNA maturation enzyme)
MIDREEEIKELKCELVQRTPTDILSISIRETFTGGSFNEKKVGTIYISNKKELQFWVSTLEIMNEKLRKRELSL